MRRDPAYTWCMSLGAQTTKPHLHLEPHVDLTGRTLQNEELTRVIVACQRGDWEAKNRLAQTFQPLLHALADKRARGDVPEINRLIGLGKEGLFAAARKFPLATGAARFRIYALDFIERSMNDQPGFWQRLFGRGQASRPS